MNITTFFDTPISGNWFLLFLAVIVVVSILLTRNFIFEQDAKKLRQDARLTAEDKKRLMLLEKWEKKKRMRSFSLLGIEDAFLLWLRVVGEGWYIILGLVAAAYILCGTDVGVDVSEYMIEHRFEHYFWSNVLYFLFLYFSAYVWATVNWITPVYNMPEEKRKLLRSPLRQAAYRIWGIAVFLITALAIGLVGRDKNADFSYPLWYFLSLCLFCVVSMLGRHIRFIEDFFETMRYNPRKLMWFVITTVLSIFAFMIFVSWFFLQNRAAKQSDIALWLGVSYLFVGLFFGFMTTWFDVYLKIDNKISMHKGGILGKIWFQFLIIATKRPRETQKLTSKTELNESETYYCLMYRFVIFVGFGVAFLFTFLPNIQPIHPYFTITSGISFYILLIDMMHFVLYRERMHFFSYKIAEGKRARVIIYIVAVAAVGIYFGGDSKAYIRTLPQSVSARQPIDTVFSDWLLQREDVWANDSTTEYPVYIIAGQGGGSRAAYWMLTNLLLLDSITEGGFREQCFAISTVSGSAPGAAAALAYWDKYPLFGDSMLSKKDFAQSVFSKNYITSGLSGLFFGDNFKKIGLRDVIADRNLRIQAEEAWSIERALDNQNYERTLNIFKNISKEQNPDWFLHRSYLSIYYDEKGNLKQKLPYFLTNTTNVQFGKRGVMSPFATKRIGKADTLPLFLDAIDVMAEKTNKNISAIDSVVHYNFTVGQAVNISELFPFMSAATTVGNLTYMDGGIYENFGIETALDIFKACKKSLEALVQATPKNSLREKRLKKVRIYLIAIINEKPSDVWEGDKEVQSISQFAVLPKVALSSMFGGHAEKKRLEAQQQLKNMDFFGKKYNAYREFAFPSNKVPLTRILTKNNIDAMNLVFEQSVLKQRDTTVMRVYKLK